MTGIDDVFDPTDVNIYRDLAGGLTTANVLHGSANPIGGRNVVMKLRWGRTRAEDFRFEGAPPGIKFALGENPKDLGERVGPSALSGFDAHGRGIRDSRRLQPRRRASSERGAHTRAASRRAKTSRRRGAIWSSSRSSRCSTASASSTAHSYRAGRDPDAHPAGARSTASRSATFQHVLEGYKVAEEIAAHGAGASTFSDWWAYKVEAIDAIPYNAALMVRKRRPRLDQLRQRGAGAPPQHRGREVHEVGRPHRRSGARARDDQPGEAASHRGPRRVARSGKDADIAIWNRHPLSWYAIVERTYIDGQLYYDRAADDRRLTELVKEKEALVAAERAGRKPDAAPRSTNGGSGASVGTNGSNGSGAAAAQPVPGAQPPTRPGPAGVLAITNARINPITRPAIERGTIVVRDGRIAAVGASVTVPSGAQIIDANGSEVYPGWINARSTIGLAEPGAGGFQDTAEMLEFDPQLRTAVTFHSDNEAIPISRANGVTTAGVTPSGGLLGGQVALMNLDGWTWEENVVASNVGIAFQFPALSAGGGPQGQQRNYDDMKKARDARLNQVARLFDQARAYAQAGPARRIDWVLEALVPVVERRLPLIVRADSEPDIREAVSFTEKQRVRMILSAGSEAAFVAPLLKEKRIPVILGPILALPTRPDSSHAASYRAAGELARAGVMLAFATGDANYVRNLPYQAAESVAWGLPREEALKALTIGAAEILGVSDRLGSIEPGKIANLLIAKGDPLEIRTEVTHVIINGRSVGLGNKHLELYERYARRP